MTADEVLKKFGLPALPEYRDEIRQLLTKETEHERKRQSGAELLRTLCLQLFSIGNVEDVFLIWEAKQSSFDASVAIDVQFLCGAGIDVTKEYLTKSTAESASTILDYLIESEQAGDFEDWTPQMSIADGRRYYGLQ